jgi:hypothetical protein
MEALVKAILTLAPRRQYVATYSNDRVVECRHVLCTRKCGPECDQSNDQACGPHLELDGGQGEERVRVASQAASL